MLGVARQRSSVDSNAYLTRREAADLLKCSVRWLVDQPIPVVRIGRMVRYRRGDIEAFMDANVDAQSVNA